ncbi:outer membrane beta-barrel protein [Legionella fairfieldensis]|uniref:outer membrane beta-barrel protein n=1 Tax=Legionella fairfieldensis TaxID=45064 RepID=UPI000490E69C|nr:outer membrane beta-barrel protein [Legionella fairfieldensis]
MINKKLALILQLSFFSFFCHAGTTGDNLFQRSFYLGAMGGYGSTTWNGLVPTEENQNLAINISTPVKVEEGGGVWGFFVGYEFAPVFALEANYMRYPDANVVFDPISIFSFDNDDLTKFITRTETASLVGKIMLLVPNTKARIYSSIGAAGVHRQDMLIDHWRLSPTFGAGLNYHFTDHLMGELGGNYTAGYGESQLSPADVYFPFLYSVSLRLAYFF